MHPEEYRRLAELESSHWWYRSLHRLVLARIDERAKRLPPRPRILDAGCGTGGMAKELASRGEVVGMDLSPIAAEYWVPGARCQVPGEKDLSSPGTWHLAPGTASEASFLRGSVSALPFRDTVFDVVISLDVLYHRAVADDVAAARELARVLRPGGLLLLNLPAYDRLRSAHDRVIHTARRYTRARVRALLAAAGLEARCVRHWNTFLFPLAAAARLWGQMRPAREESDLRPVTPWLNESLRRVVECELALWNRWEPPFGLSIIAVGEKPPAGETSCAGS
jgi:SAM-dependent methyltransferase